MHNWFVSNIPGIGRVPEGRMVSAPKVPTLGDMLQMPPTELYRLDLGLRNLLCATGLPDTADLDIGACLKKLGEWVQHVKHETERNLHRFHEKPHQFRKSEAYFRVAMMITVLQQDLKVRYDPECSKTLLFKSSNEGFIHGLLNGHGGTCANMPVLYAAVGRRLGYPIYLTNTYNHIFCRWASRDGRERFNIEGSGHGFSSFPDRHYQRGRFKVAPTDVKLGFYLRNFDPNEEVADFMSIRGHCFHDCGMLHDAVACYAQAHRLGPYQPYHFGWMMQAINDELRLHAEGKAPGSYYEWEHWDKVPKPRYNVLGDRFQRLEKAPPVFLPDEPLNYEP